MWIGEQLVKRRAAALDLHFELPQYGSMGGRHSAIAMAGLLWSATAVAEDPICPDRPSKSTGECTVPEGRWQVETGLIDWAHDRSDGVSTHVMAIGSTLIKYGLSDRADVELGVTPLEILRVSGGGTRQKISGFGDTVLRVNYKLTGDDAPILVGLDPLVKLPTANHGLGNGKVDGGLVVPMSARLGKGGVTLSIDPEFDLVADDDGNGRHLTMIQVANLGISLTDKLSVSAELWGLWNWAPGGTNKLRSADGSIAYLVNDELQIDAGFNVGLNRATPDLDLYVGVARRF